MASFRRFGLSASDEKFHNIQHINSEIQVKATRFDNAISADNTKLSLLPEELKGVPDDVIHGLTKDPAADGKVLVGLVCPTYFAVQRGYEVSATRAKVAVAFENRAYPHNKEVLRELLLKRQTFASELNFENYAAWDVYCNMARNPTTVSTFLSKAFEPLQRKWRSELDILMKSIPSLIELNREGKLRQSDLQFMMHQYKAKHLFVEENTIRKYFPAEYTIPKMFEVLGTFFNVDFVRANFADFWSEDAFCGVPKLLQELHLEHNELSGTMNLAELPERLQVFRASHNRFHGTISLIDLPRLTTELNLSANRLSGTLDLENLSADLEHVYLDGNDFTGNVSLENLPDQLEFLDIKNNQLQGTVRIGVIPEGVESIDLAGNGILEIIDDVGEGVIDERIEWP